MALGGPSATRGKSTKEGSSILHFFRVLRFARPYYRYLYPGMICVAIVAVTYSVNIMALMPVIQLMDKSQGVPGWTQQSVAERRLDLILKVDDVGQVVEIADVKKGPALGLAHAHDRVKKLDGVPIKAVEFFRTVAYLPNETRIHLDLLGEKGQLRTVAVTPKATKFGDRALLRASSWLPRGTQPADRLRSLEIMLGVILAISVFGGIARFFSEYLIALAAARTVVAMRKRMYQRVLVMPVSYFATHGVSDTVSRFVQDSQDVYRGLNFIFAKSLREPLKAIFVFIGAMYLDWRLTLITVIAAPGASILIRRTGKMIRKASKRLLQSYGRMIATLEGSLSGIRVVKGYTMESFERLRLHAIDRQMLQAQLKIEWVDAISSPIFETVGTFVGALAIVYFANQMFEGKLEFARFATLAACMAGMFDPVRKMSSFYNRIQSANAALDRVFEVIDMPGEPEAARSAQPLAAFGESIEFRNLSFTYPGAERPALDGVSLVIRRGERVAFVGPNGSGKTTLLSLLMRFFEPQSGQLLIDGRDVRESSILSLRKQMSLITQDTVLFADSIANNIAYGDDHLLRRLVLKRRHPERRYPLNGDDDRIVAAARAAYADEFIREKPEGYDTYVGEHGVQLSGGQKQRLAIARAILRNAPIFIFDEATSQVDSDSEHKIHDAVERFLEGRTALIIAHRFSTILQADRIVVMDRGRIVDSGRHEELKDRCKLYQSLYGSQLIEESDARSDTPVAAGSA